MMLLWLKLFLIILINQTECSFNQTFDKTFEDPTIMIVLLVRNKAHILPLFLTYFEQLDYPKHRMDLWIRCDHNSDDSVLILQDWLFHIEDQYHNVNVSIDDDETALNYYINETSPFEWTNERFENLIKLKETAFHHARYIWADYLFYLDVDVLLTASDVLKHLIKLDLPIVAPMLLSDGLYSNFWCGMTDEYYYQRTNDYREIYDNHKQGIFHVPMVHSAVLINLNYKSTHRLTFERNRLIDIQNNNIIEDNLYLGNQCRLYNGPLDDIIIFAIAANCTQIPLFITNELLFGYIMQPLEANDPIDENHKQLLNIKTKIINDLGDLKEPKEYFYQYIVPVKKHRLNLDHIYMINLERRPERRYKMKRLFDVLRLDVDIFSAIDGKKLNHDIIREMGIKFLIGYEDPYHHRQMTMGEIGCFLSHYNIWKTIFDNNQREVLILEDDIHFESYFQDNVERILNEAHHLIEDYDLIYLGRKRLKDELEPFVKNSNYLVHVGYSYWTLGYIITWNGARKLLEAEPLKQLLPVDEFLPIMFDKHPNKTWLSAYTKRNLHAYSVAPLLLYPTHYTGDKNYISDTEDSDLIKSYNDDNDNNYYYNNFRAQLKSDREIDFLTNTFNNNNNNKNVLKSITTSPNKYHEEF